MDPAHSSPEHPVTNQSACWSAPQPVSQTHSSDPSPMMLSVLLCCQDGEPVRPGVAMTDLATGLYCHGAIMAALLHRQKTGMGTHIDCNLVSTQVSQVGLSLSEPV